MIPSPLIRLIEQQPGDVRRTDTAPVLQALQTLGVPRESEFAEFFLKYQVTCYRSHNSDEVLVDIDDPSGVLDCTAFVHDVWALPQHLICFTPCEGEGCYLYDKRSAGVLEFSLARRQAFLIGQVDMQWNSFFEFLSWYLAE